VPVHRWVPWIAGFLASFVEDCFSAFLPKDSQGSLTVLDPFAGVGQPIVAALAPVTMRSASEINPYAALAVEQRSRQSISTSQSSSTQIAQIFTTPVVMAVARANGEKPKSCSEFAFFSPRIEISARRSLRFLKPWKSLCCWISFRVAFGFRKMCFLQKLQYDRAWEHGPARQTID